MIDSIFRLSTFGCKVINRFAPVEVVLAILVTVAGFLQGTLGTKALDFNQWMMTIVPAVLLLLVREVGKLIARRAQHGHTSTQGG